MQPMLHREDQVWSRNKHAVWRAAGSEGQARQPPQEPLEEGTKVLSPHFTDWNEGVLKTVARVLLPGRDKNWTLEAGCLTPKFT